MRLGKKNASSVMDMDMTPMIDITFQLIAFFMFTINFNNDLVNKDVDLPIAEIARPVERAMLRPLFLNVDKNGVLLTGTDIGDIDLTDPSNEERLMKFLTAEAQLIKEQMYTQFGQQSESEELKATVIIRADQEVVYGPVQDLIRSCRVAGFGTYSLRAKLKQKGE